MCLRVAVRKRNVTDRRGGAFQYLPSRAFGVAGDNEVKLMMKHDRPFRFFVILLAT